MRNWKIILLMILGAMVVTGCRSTKTAVDPAAQQKETHDYTMMTFAGTVENLSVTGQVRMDRDKVIWCSVNKFIEVGRAMATPDSVWVQVPLMGRFERVDYNELSRMTKRHITFADLQAILESDDYEREITELAKSIGLSASITITKRIKAEKLTFPFDKGRK